MYICFISLSLSLSLSIYIYIYMYTRNLFQATYAPAVFGYIVKFSRAEEAILITMIVIIIISSSTTTIIITTTMIIIISFIIIVKFSRAEEAAWLSPLDPHSSSPPLSRVLALSVSLSRVFSLLFSVRSHRSTLPRPPLSRCSHPVVNVIIGYMPGRSTRTVYTANSAAQAEQIV